ncbi:sumo-activating enzyme subunit [Anaeramoeba flamelloides]|uniref:SUMO-activating enzyme subunit n=1 Tax=Anaeramoeba flamelloides TaxID=1746091 RepID=A0AAV7Z0V1_9EUKA|nr:sumo-activating enzyme subunit [Anaeramoeba flamelloides]
MEQNKLLLIGVGGIGSEIIKCLLLSGYTEITCVDLDTIELSNLNRQFLFREVDIGKSKAQVICERSKRFNGSAKLVPLHSDIKTKGPSFFSQFSVVVTALDNVGARKYANMMCRITKTPMVDTGSAGFNGQVEVFLPGLKCFECTPIQPPKTYPVCTIRRNPEKMVHCVVWAKEEFKKEFCSKTYDSAEDEQYNELLFLKYFDQGIKDLLALKDFWKGKRKPTPLGNSKTFLNEKKEKTEKGQENNDQPQEMRILEPQEYATLFLKSVGELAKKRVQLSRPLIFDKDDPLALAFVACVANLRAFIFGITMQSTFEIKGIAGSIIPAVASTNAIVAGIAVKEVTNVLGWLKTKKDESCKSTWVGIPPKRILLQPFRLENSNKKCLVCKLQCITLKVNVEQILVKTLIKEVAKELDFESATLGFGSNCIYDPYDEMEENLEKKCCQFKIEHDSIVELDDTEIDFNVKVIIVHDPQIKEQQFQIVFHGDKPKPTTKEEQEEEEEEESSLSKNKPSIVGNTGVSETIEIIDLIDESETIILNKPDIIKEKKDLNLFQQMPNQLDRKRNFSNMSVNDEIEKNNDKTIDIEKDENAEKEIKQNMKKTRKIPNNDKKNQKKTEIISIDLD